MITEGLRDAMQAALELRDQPVVNYLAVRMLLAGAEAEEVEACMRESLAACSELSRQWWEGRVPVDPPAMASDALDAILAALEQKQQG